MSMNSECLDLSNFKPIDYANMPLACIHTALDLNSFVHANEVGFRRPTAQQRGTGTRKRKQDADDRLEESFLAPFALP